LIVAAQIVADTNVIAYLCLPSPYTEAAEQLLSQEEEWIAPTLWRSELRNVLALYLRKSLITFEQTIQIQTEMEEFFLGKEYEVPSLDVLKLVNQSNCSAYDCEFVALAQSLQTQLVTMDKKIIREFPESATLLTDCNNQISTS